MIVYAAIDLRAGRAVQLVGGNPADERISLPDALGVAREWVSAGMRALHVVDLDAALDQGSNAGLIRAIITAVPVPVQVGGGIRDEQRAAELLAAGADRLVAGTRAVEDAAWRQRVTTMFPGRIMVAADVRGDRVVTRGWTRETDLLAAELITELNSEPLAGLLITDVTREGQMTGIDAMRFERLVSASRHPVVAAGGIRDISDLRMLAELGAAGAVLGMALYTGRITPQAVAQELGA